jgi:hypothetical protein
MSNRILEGRFLREQLLGILMRNAFERAGLLVPLVVQIYILYVNNNLAIF